MNPIPARLQTYDDVEEYVRSLIEVPRRQDEHPFDEDPPPNPTHTSTITSHPATGVEGPSIRHLDFGGYNCAQSKPWTPTAPDRGGEIGEGSYQTPRGQGLGQTVVIFALACIAGTVVYMRAHGGSPSSSPDLVDGGRVLPCNGGRALKVPLEWFANCCDSCGQKTEVNTDKTRCKSGIGIRQWYTRTTSTGWVSVIGRRPLRH